MRFILITILLSLLSMGRDARAELFPDALPRVYPLSEDREQRFPIRNAEGCQGAISEAYYYTRLENSYSRPEIAAKIERVWRLFELTVYPEFTAKLAPDPASDIRRENRIILLFDDFGKGAQSDSRSNTALTRKYGRDVILMDLRVAEADTLRKSLAHELQHVFRFHAATPAADPAARLSGEELWLDEGLSKFAEYYLDSFPERGMKEFLAAPTPLEGLEFTNGESRGVEYFNAFFYVYYLYQHFGGLTLIRQMIEAPEVGERNVNLALTATKAAEKSPFLVAYHRFDRSFVAYQSALLLNRYADSLQSFGLYDLKLDLKDVPPNAAVDNEEIDADADISVPPLGSRYFQLKHPCFEVRLAKGMARAPLAILVDVHEPVLERRGRRIIAGQRECFSDSQDGGQFLILINPGTSNTSFSVRFN